MKNEAYYFIDHSSTIHLTLDEEDLDNAKVITQEKQKEMKYLETVIILFG